MQKTISDLHLVVLECIDGKDDHLKIEIENSRTIILSSAKDDNSTPIQELEEQGGAVIFTNENGQLSIDATDCPVPVKINGQLITKSSFKLNDVLKVGNSVWKMHLPGMQASEKAAVSNSFTPITQGFTRVIGLGELKDFNLKNIFSRVFKKHSFQEMEDQLVTGTIKNTPAITDIETSWAKPWLFSRLLLISIAITVVLIIGFRMFENANLIPGLIFIGSFAVPISTLVFFLEMNAARNISIFMTMTLVAVGGVASLIISLMFFQWLPFLTNWLAASAAGIIEEIGKVIIVIALFGRIARYKWILNGLLLGAAIGTGFAAFESAGYAYRTGIAGGVDKMIENITLRGLLSPFMHIIWTANAAAAFWLVKGSKKFEWNMLGDMRFLRVMFSSMILHMVWNANFTTIPLPVVYDLKYPVLGVLGWIITFRLVQAGLNELNAARHAEVQRLSAE